MPDNLSLSPSQVSRRSFLKIGAHAGLAVSGFGLLDKVARIPKRVPMATPPLPDIQFDIGNYIAPVVSLDGVMFHFAPVYTAFATYALTRNPTREDRRRLNGALTAIESVYPFAPSGCFTFVGYGLPYFDRLRRGTVSRHMPRLIGQPHRWALEEAVPSPTDVSPSNPGIVKATYNVPVTIEANDVLVIVRSDTTTVIRDVLDYLGGASTLGSHQGAPSGLDDLLVSTSTRLMFTQIGLPRRLADTANLPYATQINPQSPMWMGFADQQVSGSGPAAITTFAGNASAHVTTATSGDYFDNGAICHLSHVIEDLPQFYNDPNGQSTDDPDEPFTERCQYMFRSNPIPSVGYADQFSDGGGPAFLENTFQGADDALANAQGINTLNGEHRIGHLSALQRSSRAADGTPMHIRADGPGFDNLDVPDGSVQPKLQFCAFFPSADFFATMRSNQASLDLAAANGVDPSDNGLERFITATRRQNFLVPPRRHRAFPLLEFTARGGDTSGTD